MKFFIKAVLYTLICFIMLSACAPANESEDERRETEASGGVYSVAENINLKDISISQRQGEAFITFSFLSGSRKTGYAEKKLTQLPVYEIAVLARPQRIKIKFENISFWDYEITDTNSFPEYVLGIFREVPAQDDSLEIYIQLAKNVSFTPAEEEGSLTLKLAPLELNDDVKYFCVANAFLEHQEGRWPKALDMQPVLCADLTNKLLISQPFDTREEAHEYMRGVLESLEKSLPEKTLNVVALSEGVLPEYSIDVDYSLLENRAVVLKDGAVKNTPLLINNGRYLCAAADGRVAFARSRSFDNKTLDLGNIFSETLWIRLQNDRIQSVDIPEFFSIKKAAFSADGRYIGILDSFVENSVLYVYDFENQILHNLGEEGFGSFTSDFAWSDTDATVYASSAAFDAKIISCFFSDGGKIIDEKKEWPRGEGRLAVSQGRIFFAHSEKEKVYLLDESGKEITRGIDISVSPDGKKLLVLKKETSKGERALTGLKLYDMETGVETAIAGNTDITSFGFSQSGGKVYYTTDDGSEEFGFALFVYDTLSGNLVKDSLCRTALFFPAAEPATIYFVDYIDDNMGNGFFATFIYDISA